MTFQFGQITAASPLALSAAFSPPALTVPHDSAVVTIRNALDQLPEQVQASTLEQLVEWETTWDFQLARYSDARRISDVTPGDDDPDLQLVDAYLTEQDKLFEIPAPDAAALALKVDLFTDRFAKWIDDLPIDHLFSDALRLLASTGRETAAPDAQADGVRPVFARRLERHRRLNEAADAFETDVFTPARARFLALQENIPHSTVHLGTDKSGQSVVMTTAEAYQVRMARRAVERPLDCPEHQAAMLKLAQAADARDAEIEKAAEASGLAAARRKSDRLEALVTDSEWSFIRMPVASTAELELKIAFMIERRLFDSAHAAEDAFAALLADTRALRRRLEPSQALVSDPVPDRTLANELVH